MNCNIFKENQLNLFDQNISIEEKKELLEHIENCGDCKNEYEELKTLIAEIKPSIQVNASKEFKSKIIGQIKTETAMKSKKAIGLRVPKWMKYTAVAAIIVSALIISPFIKWNSVNSRGEVRAANSILDLSIAAMMNVRSVYYNLNIKTLEQDNFELILTDGEFVKNEIWKSFSTPTRWKIEKKGRTVLMDGKNQYLYIKDQMAIKSDKDAGFVEWLKIFLDPTLIMETEKSFAQNNKAQYTMEEKDNKTILTIKANALGDFKNDYMLNKTILESNNTRIYTFDKNTNLLESIQIYIQKNNQNVLVVDSKKIKYNEDIPDEIFAIKLPESMTWTDDKSLESINTEELKDITPEQAARIFFEGCENQDWEKVKTLCPFPIDGLKEPYAGVKVIRIGKSFKSGSYRGVYVPYEVKLKSGDLKKFNIAIRNDNKGKVWQVDGGI